ncbi:MAG: hypothetical protein WBB19_13640 [Desulforhopalus sp.]
MTQATILFIGKSTSRYSALKELLGIEDITVNRIEHPSEIETSLVQEQPDLVTLDCPDEGGRRPCTMP